MQCMPDTNIQFFNLDQDLSKIVENFEKNLKLREISGTTFCIVEFRTMVVTYIQHVVIENAYNSFSIDNITSVM